MPTLSEVQEHAADAEHQAFQRAYDALENVAKDPITCRHFWDAGRLDYARETEQELAIAYIDGHARGRESLRIELERQEPVAWAKFQDDEMTHMEMSDGSGADFDLPGYGFVPLFRHPIPPPDVRELVEALRYCRNLIGAANVRGSDQTLRMADAALAKFGGGI